jgi:acylglycerol lipase
MGGLIVSWLAANGLPDVRGVILSAAALKVRDTVAPLLRWLALPASLLLPKMGIAKLTFKKVSRDPEVIASFETDPLVHRGGLPNRTGYELLRSGARLQPRFEAVRQPLLILHGTADAITDPQGSQQLYQQAGASDKTLKLYEGLYHGLFDEPEKEQVIADLLAWLGRRRG